MRCGGRGRQPPPALWKTKRLAPLGLRRRTCSACSRAHKGHVPCVRHSSPRRTANKKRTAKMTVRSTLILASGMAKPTGSGTYVSDLACRNRAGITVTLSRGFSPHSAARLPKDRRAVRYFHFSNGSIAQKSPNCKEIPGHPDSRLSSGSPSTLDCSLEELAVLELVAQNSAIKQQELVTATGKSIATVKRIMKSLQDKSYIRREICVCSRCRTARHQGISFSSSPWAEDLPR